MISIALSFRRIGFIAFAVLLNACASNPPAPLTQLDVRRCTPGPVLASATVLDYADRKPKPVVMGAESTCLVDTQGHAASYALFVLPRERAAYELVVDSQLSGNAYFVFRLLMLDANGKPLREVSKDRHTLRGNKWRSNVFHAAEAVDARYLMVLADAATAGQTEDRLVTSVNGTMLPAGPVTFFYYSGSEARQQLTKAFNGTLEVTLLAR